MAVLEDVKSAPLTAVDRQVLFDTGIVAGSVQDMALRVRRLLPVGWFPAADLDSGDEQAPLLAGLLQGMGSVLSASWQLFQGVSGQLRLAMMTGSFLDMAAADYFGVSGLPRGNGEGDAVYRARIASSLVAPKNTRSAVLAAVQSVTGVMPYIIEPCNAADCHALASVGAAGCGGGYGYGSAGLRYGHLGGAQFFVETAPGMVSGVGVIGAAVARVTAAGVVGWVRVEA